MMCLPVVHVAGSSSAEPKFAVGAPMSVAFGQPARCSKPLVVTAVVYVATAP